MHVNIWYILLYHISLQSGSILQKFKRLFIITKRSILEIATFFTITRTSNLVYAIASYIFMSISIPKQINLDIILLIFIDYLLQGNNRKMYLFCHDQKILPCFFLMFARNIMVLTTRGTRGKKQKEDAY